jgi:hypothetical protein
MRIAMRKRRTMIEAAAYVLSNCGASVPGRGATKLHFTSTCDEAALHALKSASAYLDAGAGAGFGPAGGVCAGAAGLPGGAAGAGAALAVGFAGAACAAFGIGNGLSEFEFR